MFANLLPINDSVLGPVRGICFHNQQPLFVSGGDDYKIKVILFIFLIFLFNQVLKLRQCN